MVVVDKSDEQCVVYEQIFERVEKRLFISIFKERDKKDEIYIMITLLETSCKIYSIFKQLQKEKSQMCTLFLDLQTAFD